MEKITLDSLIEEQKKRIETLQYNNGPVLPYYSYPDMKGYESWLAKTKRFIRAQYTNDKDADEFENISKQKLSKKQQIQLLAILEAFNSFPDIIPTIDEANVYNKESPTMQVNIHNTNSQSQNQEQSLAVNLFLEAIKDDLTGRQVKELKEVIAESGGDKEKARDGIITKLKSFGSDVASNIVANIITNPLIWSSL